MSDTLLSTDQIDQIRIAGRICASFGLLASLIIIISYAFVERLRNKVNLIIVWVAVADFLIAFTAGFFDFGTNNGLAPDGVLCQIQGFLVQMFLLSKSFWIACLTTSLFLSISREVPVTSLDWLVKYYFILALGIPFLLGLGPGILVYTNNTASSSSEPYINDLQIWCVSYDITSRIVFMFIPMMISFIYTFTLFSYIMYRYIVNRQSLCHNSIKGRKTMTMQNKAIARNAAYVVIFFIFWIAPIINIGHGLRDPNNMVFSHGNLMAVVIFTLLSGVFNCLNFIAYNFLYQRLYRRSHDIVSIPQSALSDLRFNAFGSSNDQSIRSSNSAGTTSINSIRESVGIQRSPSLVQKSSAGSRETTITGISRSGSVLSNSRSINSAREHGVSRSQSLRKVLEEESKAQKVPSLSRKPPKSILKNSPNRETGTPPGTPTP